MRTSKSIGSLPSPPPAIPLPPLPRKAQSSNVASSSTTTVHSGVVDGSSSHGEDGGGGGGGGIGMMMSSGQQIAEEQASHIRTIEKHLFAEKQLTASLEEALDDIETQGIRVKAEMEGWKKKAQRYEEELASSLLRERTSTTRYSVQVVEEERIVRKEAEAARAQLEERMAAISCSQKKKKECVQLFLNLGRQGGNICFSRYTLLFRYLHTLGYCICTYHSQLCEEVTFVHRKLL